MLEKSASTYRANCASCFFPLALFWCALIFYIIIFLNNVFKIIKCMIPVYNIIGLYTQSQKNLHDHTPLPLDKSSQDGSSIPSLNCDRDPLQQELEGLLLLGYISHTSPQIFKEYASFLPHNSKGLNSNRNKVVGGFKVGILALLFSSFFFYESLCIMQRHTNSRMLIQMYTQSNTSTLQKKW